MNTRNRSLCLVALLFTVAPAWANTTAQTLPFTQNWSDAGVITTNDTWTNVPGIVGYRGDGLVAATGVDPQTITADGTMTPVQVVANQTTPNTNMTGGLAEFAITNPVVAFQGSGTADAPFLLLHLDTRGHTAITVSYVLRDIDGSADNSIQAVALQYRVGSTGLFTNVPGGFLADASTGPSLAVLTSNVSQVLPAAADNQALVQVRIITADAAGADEWIGVDDLSVTGTSAAVLSGTGLANPSTVASGASSLLTVNVTPAASPASTGITVRADLSTIGGSATQSFVDDGTGGDVTAADNIFSFNATTSGGAGVRTLPVSIADGQARTASTNITLSVQVPSSPSGVVTVNPSSNDQGGQSLLTVAVTPGTVPASTGLAVVADLTPVGGSATQALLDDGVNGDVTPGDNIFSFRVNIPGATTPGTKTLNVLITDAQTRSASPSTTLTVRAPTNPVGAGDATPSSAAIGSQLLLTVRVTPGTNPTSTGLTVTGDLTDIGGSATQAFFDDGTNGDATGGDLLFSFRAAIAGGTTTGGKTLPVVVRDAQSRSGNTSCFFLVTFGAGPTAVGSASPSSVAAGGSTLLTATVTPGNNPTSTLIAVTGDLTSIGGSSSTTFFDDGTNGDVTSGDNVFSRQVTVGAGTPTSNFSLPLSISDGQSRTSSSSVALSVVGPTNPSATALANPASVAPGGQTLLTVTVTPGANPTSTGLAVSVDLSSIGGSATQALRDDGTAGDVTAGDNIFSFNATVTAGTAPGARTLPVSISDAQARSASANLALSVSPPPSAPVAVASASPTMGPPGSTVLLTVAVTPGANPVSTLLAVSADLSAIGGSPTQAFLDNGALGDVTAGDNTFTFRAIIAAATATGAKSMPVTVADGQGRNATASLSLTVSPGPSSPVATGTATPASVVAGGMTLFEVTVTPGANPVSTGLTATIDLRPVGGAASQALRDDGLNGDATAADGIFSHRGSVPLSTTSGLKSLPVAVVDAQARTASTTIAVTVTSPPSNPSAVASANPSTVTPGSTTLLTVTVTPGTSPVSTGLTVRGNLTSIGGSGTQVLHDDGTLGDVTAADGVFSFSAVLPATVVPGARTLPFTVTDAEARSASASTQVIVAAAPASCGNSVIEAGEQCDDGNTNAGDCCSPMCAFEPSDTVCRATGGSCDVAETCTGISARCPGDVKVSGVCRPAAGVCDLAERCDGLTSECPADAFSTEVCRAAAGSCDVAEQCDGSSVACPANGSAPEEQMCSADSVCRAGVCTQLMTGANPPMGCSCAAGAGGGAGGALLGLLLLAVVARRRRS